jgi:hypothetical protein
MTTATADRNDTTTKPTRSRGAAQKGRSMQEHEHELPEERYEYRVVEDVPVGKVQNTADTQIRKKKWDKETVLRYADLYKRGVEMPDMEAVYDAKADTYWLTDGFNRFEALTGVTKDDNGDQVGLGRKKVRLKVTDGDKNLARWLSARANWAHGLPLTRAERRHAIERAVIARPTLSAREIARHIGGGCDKNTVTTVKKELSDVAAVAAKLEAAREELAKAVTEQQALTAKATPKPEEEEARKQEVQHAEVKYQEAQAAMKVAKELAKNAGYVLGADGLIRDVTHKTEPAPEAPVKDATGARVPKAAKGVHDLFADDTLPKVLAEIEAVKVKLTEDSPKSWAKAILSLMPSLTHLSAANGAAAKTVEAELKQAAVSLGIAFATLKECQPHAICPACKGRKQVEIDGIDEACPTCMNSCGYVTQPEFEELLAAGAAA